MVISDDMLIKTCKNMIETILLSLPHATKGTIYQIGPMPDLFESQRGVEAARRVVRAHFKEDSIGFLLARLREKRFQQDASETALAKTGAHSDQQEFLFARCAPDQGKSRRFARVGGPIYPALAIDHQRIGVRHRQRAGDLRASPGLAPMGIECFVHDEHDAIKNCHEPDTDWRGLASGARP